MTASAHAFEPNIAGDKCAHLIYPEWRRCDAVVDDPIHDGTRPAPPELEFPCPPCSICGEDTYHEDEAFWCDGCGAQWSVDGREGSWNDPDAQRCGSTYKPFDRADLGPEHESIRHHVSHCVYAKGHEGHHRADEWTTWS